MSESIPSTQNSGLCRQIHREAAYVTLAFCDYQVGF